MCSRLKPINAIKISIEYMILYAILNRIVNPFPGSKLSLNCSLLRCEITLAMRPHVFSISTLHFHASRFIPTSRLDRKWHSRVAWYNCNTAFEDASHTWIHVTFSGAQTVPRRLSFIQEIIEDRKIHAASFQPMKRIKHKRIIFYCRIWF